MRSTQSSIGASRVALALVLTLAIVACERATLPESATWGSAPVLPPPRQSSVPTVVVPAARGWPPGATPQGAPGIQVTALARGLDHPRWLYVLPDGDVLVSESNTPPHGRFESGLKGWIAEQIMKRAGAGGSSADRISLLRGIEAGGAATTRAILLDGLNSPFGIELVGNDLYVANTDAVLRFLYAPGATRIFEAGTKVADLPAGSPNYHWTRNLLATPDGTKLLVTVGSNSNDGENGMDKEVDRAAIWEIDLHTGRHRIFASGLRNPNGLAWEPRTGALWTTVNERDELGSDLVPDYLTVVRDGAFYGWPYAYFGQHVDPRQAGKRHDLVAEAVVPDYALGNHTASLGLAFTGATNLPDPFREGAFVAQHGSWNRNPPSGYKVVFVPFHAGRPSGPPIDVLTGFLSESGEAYGRPVGLAVDSTGALLVADDVGNTIWRLTR